MWTPSWMRGRDAAGAARTDAESGQQFVQAVEEARGREVAFRPLFDQLVFSLRMAESTVPIDRATVPLTLTMGPARIKELSAQVKLSPFLKNNIQALVHHYREDLRDLATAERAAEVHRDQPQLTVRPEAIQLVQGLFQFMAASREQFRDYPQVYELLHAGGIVEEAPTQAIPDDLQFFLAERKEEERPVARAGLAIDADQDVRNPENVLKLIGVAPITLEVGVDLVPLIDPAMGGDLMDRILPVRLDVALELGFVMPGVQFKDNAALEANTYQIRVRGNVVAVGELMMGHHLAIENPQTDAIGVALVGFPTTDPVNGRPATWVTRTESQRASKLGFNVLDPTHVLVAHMDEVVRAHAYEILSLDEVALMLAHLRESAPHTVDAVVPSKLELVGYHAVLKHLLAERVSIRDQATILECLARNAHMIKDPRVLAELVRGALARQISASLADANGVVHLAALAPDLEQVLIASLTDTPVSRVLCLDPVTSDALVDGITAECEALERPVVLCDASVRSFVKELTMRRLPRLAVVSHADLHPQYRVRVAGTVVLAV